MKHAPKRSVTYTVERKLKKISDKLSVQIMVRFSPKEADLLKWLSTQKDLSVSKLIRKAISKQLAQWLEQTDEWQ